ncbi:hypothetical protein ACFYUY_01650 [Kitasatospora sp. NPDC004745]|uniref:hypothetical protein n=1 Tax=Kitasatospora sp. NPDC004745 TaxID=3364019 RepID=UPI0036C8CE91
MNSAYTQDLIKQRDRAAAERRAAETELGQRRRQVAELTEQLATAQAAASERAALLEHARDLLEPWGGHGDAWPDIAPAIEELIQRAEQAEARIAAARALHRPVSDRAGWLDSGTYDGVDPACDTCGAADMATPWPCPTISALDGPPPRSGRDL